MRFCINSPDLSWPGIRGGMTDGTLLFPFFFELALAEDDVIVFCLFVSLRFVAMY